MQNQIEKSLTAALNPELIEVVNESHKHNVPKDAESHFKIIAVSEIFSNLNRIERNRMIFKILEKEFKSMHALSLALFTPQEWQQKSNKNHITPPCAKQRQ